MSKKKPPADSPVQKIQARIQSIAAWMHKNQNWVYIAIIGFCLSVTILYKLGQIYGWWV
ncbi:hypothetical protein [Methanoregula boonei]|uniref:hypothetical protein n=1 Tax=Methanoregula boonei TaxID=358766 RepID=UPI0012FA9416|nr:hypothetical protein [Methanoregula boonei]